MFIDMETKETKTTGAAESNRAAGGRAKVIRDAEDLIVALDAAMDKLPKHLRYSGSHAALAKQYGASMYAKMNSMSYCTEDPRARRSYCQAALGDYEALKLEKRLCFRRRGAVKTDDGAKSPDAYYIGKGAAARIDELLGEVGRQLAGLKKSLDARVAAAM